MPIDTAERAQEVIRAWLREVLEAKKWSPHRLANEAKISPATISRALNDDQFTTSTTTIEKIVRATGIPTPSGIGISASAPGQGLTKQEAIFINRFEDIAEIGVLTGSQSLWQLKSRSVELAGYLPGDFLIVDPDVQPQARDLVCLHIHDLRTASGEDTETAFRVYDPPYLITKTMDRGVERKPLLVDNERVMIWGTVVTSIRIRA